MKGLRWWCVATVTWIFTLYAVASFYEPLELTPFVYPFMAAVALLMLLSPYAQRLPALPVVLGVPPVTIAVKALLGHPILGDALAVTLVEIAIVEVTVYLAGEFGRNLSALQLTVNRITTRHLEDRTAPFDEGQVQIARELRRARRHERPLSMIAIRPCTEGVGIEPDRLMEQVQRENIERYVHAQVAQILADNTNACEVITRRGNHFVALAPETDHDGATHLADRVAAEAAEKLGVRLRIGISSFPDEELTLTRLLERAEAEMEAADDTDLVDSSNGADHRGVRIGRRRNSRTRTAGTLEAR